MRGCLHSAFLAGEGRRSDRSSRKLARHDLFLVIALAIGRTVKPASIFNPTVFVGP